MGAMGIEFPGLLGVQRYLGTCPFRGTPAHHVIAATPLGKMTLLLAPGRRIEAPGAARSRGLCAIVRPAGGGCLAIVGESRRGLERVCSMVLQA